MRRCYRIIFRFIGGIVFAILLGRGMELVFPTENPWFWFFMASITALICLLVEIYVFKTPWLRVAPENKPPVVDNSPPISNRSLPETEEDEESAKQNPGNHTAVIRLIVKAETVEQIDLLFSSYINAPAIIRRMR